MCEARHPLGLRQRQACKGRGGQQAGTCLSCDRHPALTARFSAPPSTLPCCPRHDAVHACLSRPRPPTPRLREPMQLEVHHFCWFFRHPVNSTLGIKFSISQNLTSLQYHLSRRHPPPAPARRTSATHFATQKRTQGLTRTPKEHSRPHHDPGPHSCYTCSSGGLRETTHTRQGTGVKRKHRTAVSILPGTHSPYKWIRREYKQGKTLVHTRAHRNPVSNIPGPHSPDKCLQRQHKRGKTQTHKNTLHPRLHPVWSWSSIKVFRDGTNDTQHSRRHH